MVSHLKLRKKLSYNQLSLRTCILDFKGGATFYNESYPPTPRKADGIHRPPLIFVYTLCHSSSLSSLLRVSSGFPPPCISQWMQLEVPPLPIFQVCSEPEGLFLRKFTLQSWGNAAQNAKGGVDSCFPNMKYQINSVK